MIYNFFEFKLIQFKTNIIALKKASTVMLFLCIFSGTLFPNFSELYFPSSFLLVRLSKKFLKKSNFFLAPPKLFSHIFRSSSKFFRAFPDIYSRFSRLLPKTSTYFRNIFSTYDSRDLCPFPNRALRLSHL